MADIKIRRIATPMQTLGTLEVGEWSCWTLELPWKSNRLRESCIPPEPGHDPIEYEARKHNSPQFGETIYLPNVSARSEILIHAGNFVSDTAGCILVGSELRHIDTDGVLDVTSSQATLRKLLEITPEEMTIDVGWHEQPEGLGLADEQDVDIAELATV